MAQRETENNAYAKFWGDKQRALWYVMVFSGVVNIMRTALNLSVTQQPCKADQPRSSNKALDHGFN